MSPSVIYHLRSIKKSIIWIHYEGKEWILLNPKIQNNWRAPLCLNCGNILNDRRAYCTYCGYKCGHWEIHYTTEPCFICGKQSIMFCVQCDRPICINCSKESKSHCHYVGSDGFLNIGHCGNITKLTKRYTCIECQKEMDEKNSKFNTITYKNKLAEINTSNEYVRGVSYKSTGSCIWHNRRQIETCIICNKPLCDICAYYEIKSFFGFNKKIIGPFCFGHMPKEKNWTIFLEKEGREFTVSK